MIDFHYFLKCPIFGKHSDSYRNKNVEAFLCEYSLSPADRCIFEFINLSENSLNVGKIQFSLLVLVILHVENMDDCFGIDSSVR